MPLLSKIFSRCLTASRYFALAISSAHAMGPGLTAPSWNLDQTRLIQMDELISRDRELSVQIRYEIRCESDRYQMIPGEIEFEGRTLRFDLFSARRETEILLGTPSAGGSSVSLSLADGTDCKIQSLVASIKAFEPAQDDRSLAIAHAPFLNVRPDQIGNRLTDLPILISYSIVSAKDGGYKTIRYTIFFTDEDSEDDARGTEFQMARYGRRTDIEWIYEVELDSANQIVSRKYQGALILNGPLEGVGHKNRAFRGQLSNGQHPVLYNVANHNVFSDKPMKNMNGMPFVGYQLVPTEEIPCCSARESSMLRNPWTFKVSDVELARENKLGAPSTHYLYVAVTGKLRGAVNAVLALQNGTILISNEGYGSLDRLGEDLWNQESYVAIPVDESTLFKIESGAIHGNISFVSANSSNAEHQEPSTTDFIPEKLRFFRIVNDSSEAYKIADLNHHFTCSYSKLDTACSF